MHCDDTLSFLLCFPSAIKIFIFTLCVPCAEKRVSDVGFVFSSYLRYFTLVICYLLYFSNLHSPTVYMGRHNLSLGRKRYIVSVFVFQMNFNLLTCQNCFPFREESKSCNQSSFLISFLIYFYLDLPENCSSS